MVFICANITTFKNTYMWQSQCRNYSIAYFDCIAKCPSAELPLSCMCFRYTLFTDSNKFTKCI